MALAFAGNDLVNFIGVPIAGYQSFLAWVDSGLSADNYTMEILSEKVAAPTEILFGAGAIMIITLWTSSKAKSVIKTSIDLSNQEETVERCGLAEDYWSERLEFQRYRTTSYAESQNRKRGQ